MKRAFLSICLGLFLIGCGGSGDSSSSSVGGNQVTPMTYVSEVTKINFLVNCGVKVNSWRALPKEVRDQKLIAWAKLHWYIAEADIVPGGNQPFFRYVDGDSSVYANDRVTGVPTGAPPPLVPFAADQPGKTKAVCAYSFKLGEFEDVTPTIAGVLNAHGYQATRAYNPTLPDILNWSGSGVLFWQAHGGYAKEMTNGKLTTRFCIDTGETATDALSRTYAHYRSSRELMLAGREVRKSDGTLTVIPEYAISDLFVRNHLKFANNTLICVDACTSGNASMGPAFNGANAGTYVGWSAEAGPSSAKRFLQIFDRLTGDNGASPISHPDERPFDMDATQTWMQNKAYDHDPSSGFSAQLLWYKRPSSRSLMLNPTIYRVLHESSDAVYKKSKFLIEGTFGPDPGTSLRSVVWGNTTCEVLTWHPTNGIRIKLPVPYPTGSIQVIKDGRKSNSVPLTQWNIPLTYKLTGKGTLYYEVKMNVRVRADVRGARYLPEDPLHYHPVTVYTLEGCTGTATAGGQYKPNPDTTISWSGSTAIKSHDTDFPANSFDFSGYFEIDGSQLKVTSVISNATYTQTEIRTSGTTTSDRAMAIDGLFLGFTMPLNKTTYVIGAGSVPNTFPIGTEHGVSAKMSWTASTPVNPPTDATPR